MNAILCGVGGQGTVLASRLIARAAMNAGLDVRTAETIGMAQRGGCVTGHVRTGKKIASPMVPVGQADLLMGFEPAEALRALPYLKKSGVAVVAKRPVAPVTATLAGKPYDGQTYLDQLSQRVKTYAVDVDAICAACGSDKVANVALLGAASALGVEGLDTQALTEALKQQLPEKFWEMNIKALQMGADAVKEA